VVSTILASSEYHTLLVRAAFETYLHRDPDPIGLNAFVSFLNSGGTVEQMQSLIISSAEYLQVRGGGTNLGFIETLYLDALHRPSDSFGRANNDLLLAGGGTRGQVADAIFASGEYRGVFIEDLYERYLHRTADSGGLNAFEGLLQQGSRDEQVIALITGSDEYFARV